MASERKKKKEEEKKTNKQPDLVFPEGTLTLNGMTFDQAISFLRIYPKEIASDVDLSASCVHSWGWGWGNATPVVVCERKKKQKKKKKKGKEKSLLPCEGPELGRLTG